MKIRLSTIQFLLLYPLLCFFLYSHQFIYDVFVGTSSVKSFIQMIFTFLLLLTTLHYIEYIALFSYKTKLLKGFAMVNVVINSLACYFTNTYNIYLDNSMIANIVNTDINEASDLFNLYILVYVVFLGLLPAYFISKIEFVKQKSPLMAIKKHVSVILVLLMTCGMWFAMNTKTIITFWRNNNDNISKIIPHGYYSGVFEYTKRRIKAAIIDDAPKNFDLDLKYKTADNNTFSKKSDKKIMIMIVGETARKNNFSLYGYQKDTNPLLAKQKDLFVFKDMTSCGTNTSQSVPCIFYPLGSKSFQGGRVKIDGYLDYLKKLPDFDIIWYDNNFGGCYGNCNNVETHYMQKSQNIKYCKDSNCVDEAFLEVFETSIQNSKKRNILIVFHQNGSHGPLYYKRYPKEFEKFTPTCSTNNPQDCSTEELVNAYDNTIVYTDYIVSNIITRLQSYKKYDSFVLYTSDHGESLGENGLYLHGVPYSIAPRFQKEVPLVAWLSPSIVKKYNKNCLLVKTQNGKYTHDALINSALGFFEISSSQYKQDYDIFYDCNNKQ